MHLGSITISRFRSVFTIMSWASIPVSTEH